jgi:hypothetical protein
VNPTIKLKPTLGWETTQKVSLFNLAFHPWRSKCHTPKKSHCRPYVRTLFAEVEEKRTKQEANKAI